MDATYYLILMEVHVRDSIFRKGQRFTLEGLGPYAFTLLRYGLVRADLPALPAVAWTDDRMTG